MKKRQVRDFIESNRRELSEIGDLRPLIKDAQNREIVMIGEASHGTHEFYRWRADLTRELIERNGISCVAVEGDWPHCYEINRFVKGYEGAPDDPDDVLREFTRWPSWMWANEEVREFIVWLRGFNQDQPEEKRVGFYGLDMYSLWESLEAVLSYVREKAPEYLEQAQEAFDCFEPYGREAQRYANRIPLVPEGCEREVIDLLVELGKHRREYDADPEASFNAEQNAMVAKNAEEYYRTMVYADTSSWNLRDRHMMDTLLRLKRLHGKENQVVVWEHNTHIGDARATPMRESGEFNIGQLGREKYGAENVMLIGFGSQRGEVIAGRYWDAPAERMRVPQAIESSWENAVHGVAAENQWFYFAEANEELPDWIGHRAIGVVYHPEREKGNYVPSIMTDRYDAFLHIDETTALRPLFFDESEREKPPQTFPSGR